MRRSTASRWVLCLLLSACAGNPSQNASSPVLQTPSDATSDSPSASASEAAATPSPTAPASPSASLRPEPLVWAQVDATGPAAREDHTWTVDPGTGIAYLFGGRDGATVLADTWAYDLATETWSQLAPTASPPARFGHEATWVDGIGLVIFAGQAGSAFFNDLWAYDPGGNTWAALPATGAIPNPRYGSCAAVGPDGRLWISHGFTSDGTRFSDTRAYDFATDTWTDESPVDGQRPVERCLHGCWWTDAGQLTLYAGQTTGTTALDDRWTFAEGAWTRIEGTLPPPRNLYARIRVEGGTMVFGGQAIDESYLGDLWMLTDDDPNATPLEVGGDGPAGRAGAELVLDAERGRALLFGGRSADGALGDLWTLSGL